MPLHDFQGIPAESNEPIVDTGREALYEETLQTMEAWQNQSRSLYLSTLK